MKPIIYVLIALLLAPFFFAACIAEEAVVQTAGPAAEPIREPANEPAAVFADPAEVQHEPWRQNVTAAISGVEYELESKGWGDFETIEGEPDSRNLWGVIHEPTKLEEGASLYTILGHVTGDYYDPIMEETTIGVIITVVVKIIFSSEAPEGECADVYYVSGSGRTLHGDRSENLPGSHSSPYKIFAAGDEGMWHYMCSY
jgi:hypothetical protein